MLKTFLIGRFLQSHAGVYQYNPPLASEEPCLSREVLEKRFRERAHRFRMERYRHVLRFQVGLAIAVLMVIGAFNLDLSPGDADPLRAAEQEVVTMQEILQTRQEVKPPPPPRPPVPVEVPNDTILENDELVLGDPLDFTALVPLPPPPAPEPAEEPEEELFTIVEQMPEIIGGQAALISALEYPLIAQRAGIEGMVVVHIIIGTDGAPSMPEIIRSAHTVLDEAAVAAVMQLNFTPGRQRGKPVRVRMAIPVNFRLRNG